MTSVLLVTSNGTGMGHLTRQAAVALSVAGEHETALFSLSVGLPLAAGLGVRGEYAPSYDRPWIAGREWHGYLRDRLLAIIEETRADVVVFDGVAVYPGIAMASSARRDVAFIWLRRGMWQEATNTGQLRRVGHFDLVVEPGDLAGASTGPTARARNVIRVAPVSLIEVIDPLPRDEARSSLGLPSEGDIALVTLGSGMLGDVAGPGQAAIETLLTESDAWIAVTRPSVARNLVEMGAGERMIEIRDVYPQVRYLGAFDLAVSSAGYNAVHELIPAGVPTVFVANSSTRTDDQMARSRRVAGLGLGLHASDLDPESVASGVKRLLDPGYRAHLAGSAAEARAQMLGASEVSQTAITLADGFSERRRKPSAAVSDTVQRAKDSLKDRLGEERTESLKRALGRQPTPRGQRTTVQVVPTPQRREGEGPVPLALTSDLDRSDLDLGVPIEHLLPGSSEGYRARRLELIANYYDVL
jgi:predicted glycosyltransferase